MQSTNLEGKCPSHSLVSSAVVALDGGKGREMMIFYSKAAGGLKQYILVFLWMYGHIWVP